MHEELRHIARPEDLVDGSKVCGSLFVAEIRCENAASHTFPPEELASSTSQIWGPVNKTRVVVPFHPFIGCHV
ncbi:hypothetical protein DsansV1_C05g0054851 [Dioscorea sansibarensis]